MDPAPGPPTPSQPLNHSAPPACRHAGRCHRSDRRHRPGRCRPPDRHRRYRWSRRPERTRHRMLRSRQRSPVPEPDPAPPRHPRPDDPSAPAAPEQRSTPPAPNGPVVAASRYRSELPTGARSQRPRGRAGQRTIRWRRRRLPGTRRNRRLLRQPRSIRRPGLRRPGPTGRRTGRTRERRRRRSGTRRRTAEQHDPQRRTTAGHQQRRHPAHYTPGQRRRVPIRYLLTVRDAHARRPRLKRGPPATELSHRNPFPRIQQEQITGTPPVRATYTERFN